MIGLFEINDELAHKFDRSFRMAILNKEKTIVHIFYQNVTVIFTLEILNYERLF